MRNKLLISKMKHNAELAQAAYGYYDLIGKKFRDRQDEQGNALAITLHDILDSVYNGYIAMGKNRWGQDIELGTLNGDFTPTQAENFFKRYDLLEHCPNTDSGFSATLFKDLGEVDKKANTRKAVDKDSQYILSFRGTGYRKVAQC